MNQPIAQDGRKVATAIQQLVLLHVGNELALLYCVLHYVGPSKPITVRILHYSGPSMLIMADTLWIPTGMM